ncbi:MAG: phytanoyl-CoA dioxygenase family protein [Gemmatimonadetes bacterium]|nr:phytanoyl-CoA dioxygenase family protein [Gemmatimonadota bacterium]MBT7860023.1 phytanoyl-CoA dioxygenase family protein [Gemmatimonadota bacterium]
MIRSADIEAFHQQGYCVIRDLFGPDEIQALRHEVLRFQREGLVRNVRTQGDGETLARQQANLQLIPLYDKSDLIRALPFDDRVVTIISTLIGDPFLLHLDQLFLKPGRHGTGTSWHQDNAYFKIGDPLKGTAMWLAIDDATTHNGTLRLIPGSHRIAYEHKRDPFSDHHIRCWPPEAEAETIEVAAGGAAFFCYGTAHCTGDNSTPHSRTGMAFHFLNGDHAADDLVPEGRDHRPWVTGSGASGGQSEYGIDVRGEFSRLISSTA